MQKKMFPDLGIDAEILKAIEKLGFEQPSPIQAEAIPVALSGRDVVGQSQTGSGKTMAFAVPGLQVVDPADKSVQMLVMCPTRELAMQVCAEIHKLLPGRRGVCATPIYGGAAYDHQIRALNKGSHIVVGTPGRILDFVRRGTLKLGGLKMLVFDEADEMLDMGFRDEIEELTKQLPESRQTIFFSATMSKPIRNLIDRATKDAATITIEHKTLTVPTIEQRYYEVYGRSKIEVLCRVLDTESCRKAIVFANTKRAVDDISDALVARGYTSDRLHGDLTQTMRDRVMKKFRTGGIEILSATDVAARGLDVEDIDLIFNYDLPYDEEDYVHRIGRTGRAGREGKAISLVIGREIFLLERIQRYIKTNIKRTRIPSLEDLTNTRVEIVFEKIRATLESGEFAPHDHTVEKLLDAGFISTNIASALIHLLLKESERETEEIAEDRKQHQGRREPRGDRGRPDDRGGRDTRGRGDDRGGDGPPRPRRQSASRDGVRRTRMFINVGHVDEVSPGQIAGAIYNSANLPEGSLGAIEIFDRSSYVEIPDDLVEQTLSGIQGAKLRGRNLRMDLADNPERQSPPRDDRRSKSPSWDPPGQRPFSKNKGKPKRFSKKPRD
jgi:ATP-dependent RNA helicase DeaD